MDDIAEQHDISREITEAISSNVAFPNDIDEDELEKELEELEQVRDTETLITKSITKRGRTSGATLQHWSRPQIFVWP